MMKKFLPQSAAVVPRDELDEPNVVYPVTAEVIVSGGLPALKQFDCLEDFWLEMKRIVCDAVQMTDREVIPRGQRVCANGTMPDEVFGMFANAYQPAGVAVCFEFKDTHEVCVTANVRFHMPVILSETLH